MTSSRCIQCKDSYYCSKICQLKDWNDGHKEECKKLKNGEKYEVFCHIKEAPKDKCNIYLCGTFRTIYDAQYYVTKKNHEFPFFQHFYTSLGDKSYRECIKKAVWQHGGMVEEEIEKFNLDTSLYNVRIEDNKSGLLNIRKGRYGKALSSWNNMLSSKEGSEYLKRMERQFK